MRCARSGAGGPHRWGWRIDASVEVTDAQADLFREFQRRGWMRDDLDPDAQSAFVQAMIIGRVIDDVAERPIGRDPWIAVSMPAFCAVLFGD